jgi:putative phosphoribosyl transferase
MDARPHPFPVESYLVCIDVEGAPLEGQLEMPAEPRGIVLIAHGSATEHHSARNNLIAQSLREDVGVGTLLIDLLSEAEEAANMSDAHILASRLVAVCDWLTTGTRTRGLPIGLFGASTASAAALLAAAERPDDVTVVVSRRGEVDPERDVLDRVRAPTLLLDDDDAAAIDLRAASWFDRYLPVLESRDEPRG